MSNINSCDYTYDYTYDYVYRNLRDNTEDISQLINVLIFKDAVKLGQHQDNNYNLAK